MLLETVHSNCLQDGERMIPKYRQPFDLLALVLAGKKEKATSEEVALWDLEKWLPLEHAVRNVLFMPTPSFVAAIESGSRLSRL